MGNNKLGFNLILSAVDENLHNEFMKSFSGFPDVECEFSRFEDIEFDCIVSAANSFGLMDGGVDQCITDYFGIQMMHRVQDRILKEFAGEQPVGTSIIVLGDKEIDIGNNKYVAHTPTMRVPRDVIDSDNPYKAMKAALLAVQHHNMLIDCGEPHDAISTRINTLVTPGLATLCGRVPYDTAANQMALATYHVMNPPKAINWYYASDRDGQIQESRYINK
jgi:O-acetyl-ADP-ribose deacetylase (regulator of RNase III)